MNMRRTWLSCLAALLLGACANQDHNTSTSVHVGVGVGYHDPWYHGGYYPYYPPAVIVPPPHPVHPPGVRPPGEGRPPVEGAPPRPTHPIALPPASGQYPGGSRPSVSQPIAKPPASAYTPSVSQPKANTRQARPSYSRPPSIPSRPRPMPMGGGRRRCGTCRAGYAFQPSSDFTSVNSSRPSTPHSRPLPDCL